MGRQTDRLTPLTARLTLGSTAGLMKCAHEVGGPRVKRFVLLGSAVAVLDSFQDESVAGADYNEKDWNPVSPTFAVMQRCELINTLGNCSSSDRIRKSRTRIQCIQETG